jgi:mono/diheme cytochrome c family protein
LAQLAKHKRGIIMLRSILIATTAVSIQACTPDQDSTRVDTMRGKQLFTENCAVCHGTDANGAGIASLGLGAPPPGLLTLSAKNDGVFPRDHVLSTIDGLSRHDHPTAAMPEFGASDMGPTILVEEGGLGTPIPANLLALAIYLESIQN